MGTGRRDPSSFRKVSKPLMEKKRRARINVSLEQLKTLLEKNYSHQIRKRKLEKADILELSVKYVKSLQLSIQGASLMSPDYHAGFRNCLQTVREFLLRSEAGRGGSSFQLLQQLSQTLPARGHGDGPLFSTTDSDPQAASPGTQLASPSKQWPPQVPSLSKGRSGVASWEAPSQAAGFPEPQSTPRPSPQLWRPW